MKAGTIILLTDRHTWPRQTILGNTSVFFKCFCSHLANSLVSSTVSSYPHSKPTETNGLDWNGPVCLASGPRWRPCFEYGGPKPWACVLCQHLPCLPWRC